MNSPHCLKPYRPPSCWEATSDKIAFIAPFSWAFPHFICEMWETSSLFLSRLDTSELYTGFFVILSFYAEKKLSLSVICMYWVSCMKANPVLVPQVISTLAKGFYFHTSHLVCCHLTLFKKEWCWVFQRFLFHIFRWYEIQGIRGEEFRKTIFSTQADGTFWITPLIRDDTLPLVSCLSWGFLGSNWFFNVKLAPWSLALSSWAFCSSRKTRFLILFGCTSFSVPLFHPCGTLVHAGEM